VFWVCIFSDSPREEGLVRLEVIATLGYQYIGVQTTVNPNMVCPKLCTVMGRTVEKLWTSDISQRSESGCCRFEAVHRPRPGIRVATIRGGIFRCGRQTVFEAVFPLPCGSAQKYVWKRLHLARDLPDMR